MRNGLRRCHIFTPIIGLIFGLVVSENVLAGPPQETKQPGYDTAAAPGCPRQEANQQVTNQGSKAVPVSLEDVIVPTAPSDQMILLELQSDPGPMFWIENLIKSQHKEITSPSDIQLYGVSAGVKIDHIAPR
jgi:hypothetical protein